MIVRADNPWGRSSGREPQRSDLWYIDFTSAFDGIMGRGDVGKNTLEELEYDGQYTMGNHANLINPFSGDRTSIRYYATSVNLPELVTTPEVTRRDSKPYHSPGCDSPLGAIKVSFIHDISNVQDGPDGIRRSEIYSFLSLWRTLVRSGRGGMSSEFSLALDRDFKVNYGFDVSLSFLGGVDLSQALAENPAQSGLEVTSVYTMKNCWLSSFGLGPEISFSEARHSIISAIFYADDVVQSDRH